MNRSRRAIFAIFEHALPWIVLAILLTYTYSKFFLHSYGFRWHEGTGIISHVFVNKDDLQIGDQLVQVGSLRWDEYQANVRAVFFEGVSTGDVVPITVKRAGQLQTVLWTYPGFNRGEFLHQFYSEWFLAYFFWLAGLLTVVLARPRDERWLLLSTFNFLTAIWLIAGSGNSAYHVLYSPLILRSAMWLSVPVYLHLHWVFPHSFGTLPLWLVRGAYSAAIMLMVAEWFQWLPADLYKLGFLIAVSGSLVLLVLHYAIQPEVRRELTVVLIVAILAILPAVLWGILGSSVPAGFTLLSFPLLPFSYLYAAYRHQLGTFEIRVNRFLSLYVFVILLGTLLIPLIVFVAQTWKIEQSAILIAIGTSLLTTAACLWGYPACQKFVESRWLGIRVPSKHLQEIYSARITTSTSISSLLEILKDEVFPSLFIRQYLFMQLDNGNSKVLLASGVTRDMVPFREADPASRRTNGKNGIESREHPWAKLILPLYIGESLIGLWFLGRRDPDDFYSQAEIPVLQSLANQTAIALSNILQAERLKSIYQVNIDRYEQERLRLARDLHDSVLNQMATMVMELADSVLSPGFQRAYDKLAERLREIVFDLRPPMLTYGLKPAFEELADHLMDRSKETISVIVDLDAPADQRFPANVEQHIFRIVQEACENAMHHAQADRITISGTLSLEACDLMVVDDGIGFDLSDGVKLDELLAKKHYGLLGMIERAQLIGAEISFDSALGAGTRVRIKCEHLPEDENNSLA